MCQLGEDEIVAVAIDAIRSICAAIAPECSVLVRRAVENQILNILYEASDRLEDLIFTDTASI